LEPTREQEATTARGEKEEMVAIAATMNKWERATRREEMATNQRGEAVTTQWEV
jgi:hypothetical protein